jgi:hypothetical protein
MRRCVQLPATPAHHRLQVCATTTKMRVNACGLKPWLHPLPTRRLACVHTATALRQSRAAAMYATALLKRLFQHVCAAQREESVWEPVTLMGEFRGGAPLLSRKHSRAYLESVASEPEIAYHTAGCDARCDSRELSNGRRLCCNLVCRTCKLTCCVCHIHAHGKSEQNRRATGRARHAHAVALFTLLAVVEVMAFPLSLPPSVCCCIIAHVQLRNLVSLSCVAMREV